MAMAAYTANLPFPTLDLTAPHSSRCSPNDLVSTPYHICNTQHLLNQYLDHPLPSSDYAFNPDSQQSLFVSDTPTRKRSLPDAGSLPTPPRSQPRPRLSSNRKAPKMVYQTSSPITLRVSRPPRQQQPPQPSSAQATRRRCRPQLPTPRTTTRPAQQTTHLYGGARVSLDPASLPAIPDPEAVAEIQRITGATRRDMWTTLRLMEMDARNIPSGLPRGITQPSIPIAPPPTPTRIIVGAGESETESRLQPSIEISPSTAAGGLMEPVELAPTPVKAGGDFDALFESIEAEGLGAVLEYLDRTD